LAGKAIGGTLTLYMEVSGVEKIYEDSKARVKVTMPSEILNQSDLLLSRSEHQSRKANVTSDNPATTDTYCLPPT
jgi:hypothetical protein